MAATKNYVKDPTELIVEDALTSQGIAFVSDERDPRNQNLDFYLIDFDIHIEVKTFHSDRIAEQMSRAPNVIAIQGRKAANAFAEMIAMSKNQDQNQ